MFLYILSTFDIKNRLAIDINTDLYVFYPEITNVLLPQA
jgi:hypothetical protein